MKIMKRDAKLESTGYVGYYGGQTYRSLLFIITAFIELQTNKNGVYLLHVDL